MYPKKREKHRKQGKCFLVRKIVKNKSIGSKETEDFKKIFKIFSRLKNKNVTLNENKISLIYFYFGNFTFCLQKKIYLKKPKYETCGLKT